MVRIDAICRDSFRPPFGEPRTLMAMKLKGIKDMEKTREHMDTMILFTPNSLLERLEIGIKAT